MLTTQYMTIELGLEAQEAKPNSVAIGPELSGLGQWLPISLFFATTSKPGPIKESQLCSPNQ